jgi:hypothetical protein
MPCRGVVLSSLARSRSRPWHREGCSGRLRRLRIAFRAKARQACCASSSIGLGGRRHRNRSGCWRPSIPNWNEISAWPVPRLSCSLPVRRRDPRPRQAQSCEAHDCPPLPNLSGGDILPRSLHLPRASTEGSSTRKPNEAGVRFWTDASWQCQQLNRAGVLRTERGGTTIL